MRNSPLIDEEILMKPVRSMHKTKNMTKKESSKGGEEGTDRNVGGASL